MNRFISYACLHLYFFSLFLITITLHVFIFKNSHPHNRILVKPNSYTLFASLR
ncbi:hypothetical protein Lalb_Chr11g0063931 [Lupinus albus]|uniref:Uncharacterized protein n=1 Tax=Lupinus albus TaxID=3870 RepID=A0A6A4PR03_LUPAL|nr:hypothetical protein Lalb_Chr11g0063931 [Lupinus albus]